MSKKPGILFMPHGNLQYSQLKPEKRGWAIKQSYEKIFDIALEKNIKIAFEASGETLDIIAKECPEVMEKLKKGVNDGYIEPVGSPQTHIMLANIDKEIGLESLINGRETWEKYTGKKPVVGWNPECSWASYILDIYKEAGYEILIADADSYFLSTLDDIREKTGLNFDVRGHSNKNELFKIEDELVKKEDEIIKLFRPNILPNGLKVIFRTDVICNIMLWYLMGATEGNRETPIKSSEVRDILKRWKSRIPNGRGFIMPYAEDAEYVGTTAYFYVKQFGQARFFEKSQESIGKFKEILDISQELGFEFITPSEAAALFEPVENSNFNMIENGCAWHGGTAKAWSNTAYSRILDPVCSSIFLGVKSIAGYLRKSSFREDEKLRQIVKSITTAYVSDARWPPAPTTPGRFNVKEALDALTDANNQMRDYMYEYDIAKIKSLYSPDIMETQIQAITNELMEIKYFEEQ